MFFYKEWKTVSTMKRGTKETQRQTYVLFWRITGKKIYLPIPKHNNHSNTPQRWPMCQFSPRCHLEESCSLEGPERGTVMEELCCLQRGTGGTEGSEFHHHPFRVSHIRIGSPKTAQSNTHSAISEMHTV